MLENDAEMHTEMSGSEFEGKNKDDSDEGAGGDDGPPHVQGINASPPSDELVTSDDTPVHPRLREHSLSRDTRDTSLSDLTPIEAILSTGSADKA